MKPIETGCSRHADVLMSADGAFLKEISRVREPMSRISPYCFEKPLAPMLASEMEGVEINVRKIIARFDELAAKYGAVVVEGVGGILAPVAEGYFVADLAADIGLPVVVVASPFIGTINHTLLTVNHALMRGLDVAGIIINYRRPEEGSLAEKTNPQALSRLSPAPLIGVMPYIEDLTKEALDDAVLSHLDMAVVRKYIGLSG
jgi:dethiobiotin synthetase